MVMDDRVALALGLHLTLVSNESGGRTEPLTIVSDADRCYRPNWVFRA